MKSVGIIVEYNPFHNGHKYHLKKAKEYGEIVIAVMSGNFVQRGEPACINKWVRTEMALMEGVDIVVELPVFYSCQSAEIFARGGVGILNHLGVQNIIFGSESNDIEKLKKIIEIENNKDFKERLQINLKSGDSYPTAYNKEVEYFLGKDFIVKSNDILGIEYLRAIKFWGSKIEPIVIKRKNVDYHSDEMVEDIASASGIRKMVREKNKIEMIEKYLSENSKDIFFKEISLEKITDISKFYSLIRYAILMEKEKIKDIQDVEEGYENRLYEATLSCENYKDFMEKIMTKRYTIGRVQRILIHILLGITKKLTEEVKQTIPYIKILGFSENGRKYLKTLDKENSIKIITANKNIKKIFSDKEKEFFEINEKAGKIYGIVNSYEERKIPIIY